MVIGLTGGIGTGKSTVARRLIEKGYPVIDTDIISKEIIEKEEIIIKINEELGDVLDYNGKINRKKLGQIVFKDKKKLNVLNSIMHPIILNEMRKQINEKSKLHNIIIVDVPLLFEINIEKEFDLILLVYSTKEIQLKRIMERDNRTKEESLNIINSQMDLEHNNTLKDLYEEIDNVLEKLEKLVL